MLAILVIVAIVDALLAGLLIAVSGFIFGAGPEGMHGDIAGATAWMLSLIGCVAAPIAGFVLRHRGKAGIGLLLALLPPLGALVLSSGIIRPY